MVILTEQKRSMKEGYSQFLAEDFALALNEVYSTMNDCERLYMGNPDSFMTKDEYGEDIIDRAKLKAHANKYYKFIDGYVSDYVLVDDGKGNCLLLGGVLMSGKRKMEVFGYSEESSYIRKFLQKAIGVNKIPEPEYAAVNYDTDIICKELYADVNGRGTIETELIWCEYFAGNLKLDNVTPKVMGNANLRASTLFDKDLTLDFDPSQEDCPATLGEAIKVFETTKNDIEVLKKVESSVSKNWFEEMKMVMQNMYSRYKDILDCCWNLELVKAPTNGSISELDAGIHKLITSFFYDDDEEFFVPLEDGETWLKAEVRLGGAMISKRR